MNKNLFPAVDCLYSINSEMYVADSPGNGVQPVAAKGQQFLKNQSRVWCQSLPAAVNLESSQFSPRRGSGISFSVVMGIYFIWSCLVHRQQATEVSSHRILLNSQPIPKVKVLMANMSLGRHARVLFAPASCSSLAGFPPGIHLGKERFSFIYTVILKLKI